jgi:hypothetical protein
MRDDARRVVVIPREAGDTVSPKLLLLCGFPSVELPMSSMCAATSGWGTRLRRPTTPRFGFGLVSAMYERELSMQRSLLQGETLMRRMESP